MAQQQPHPIFQDIEDDDMQTVQQQVLADAAVLEERTWDRMTPLMYAIDWEQPAIALWLIQHRGQHNLEAADINGYTALPHASWHGPLEVMEALVAAGGNPAAPAGPGITPLISASAEGHTDVVAFLLQLPAAKATIDHISHFYGTALSIASAHGHQPIVQLLLDAGADPTIPAGQRSAAHRALDIKEYAVAALLCLAMAEPDRARALHKLRSLLSAGAASLACLQGRGEQGQAMPQVELAPPQQQQQQHKKLQATVAFAVGLSGGEKDSGLCEELYLELLGYMLPGAWADKGPRA